MLRARLSNGDFLFGIDAENVKRLKAGKPLVIDLTLMGGRNKLMICYGETLADIKREWEAVSGQPLPPESPLPFKKEG